MEFYEGETLVATAILGANGTLATATIGELAAGTHTYRARYPGDRHYRPFAFGSVTVTTN